MTRPDVRNGYWTVPCVDGCKRGRWRIGTWRIWLLRAPSAWAWLKTLPIAYRRRRCVACKGTGRAIVTLARPQVPR